MIAHDLETENLPLQGAFVIRSKEFYDERGVFLKLYDRNILGSRNVNPLFVEDYTSISKKGVVRGLHYQLAPYSQAKLVHCTRGMVFDAMIDLRRSSNTFGKWHSLILSEDNRLSVFVPRGFAHGYLSMEDSSAVSYRVDNDYAPEYERGIVWNDPSLGIDWPVIDNYVVSEKDLAWPTFERAEKFE